jgi:hypothetical protein
MMRIIASILIVFICTLAFALLCDPAKMPAEPPLWYDIAFMAICCFNAWLTYPVYKPWIDKGKET